MSAMASAQTPAQSAALLNSLKQLTPAQQTRLLQAAQLNDEGVKLVSQSNIQQGLPKVRQASAIAVELLGENNLITAEFLTQLGAAEFAAGDLQASKKALQRSLAAKRIVAKTQQIDVSMTADMLGYTLTELGDFATAQKLLDEAFGIRNKRQPPNVAEVTLSQTHLGYLAFKRGNYVLSLQYLYAALGAQSQPKNLEACKGIMPDTVSKVGRVCWEMGQYTEAHVAFESSLGLQTVLNGAESAGAASEMLNLGGVLMEIGDLEHAKDYFEKALAIQLKTVGEKNPDTAATRNNLAMVLMKQDKPAEAKEQLEKSLRIRRQLYGDKNSALGISIRNLGWWYQETSDWKTAAKIFDQALATEQLDKNDHVGTGAALYSCATAAFAQHDYQKARGQYLQANQVFSNIFSFEHPMTKASLYSVALCDIVTGNWKEAAKELENGRRQSRQYVQKVLPGFTETQQLNFLEGSDAIEFHGCLTAALSRTGDPLYRNLSAGWVLNGKAMARQMLAERAILTRIMSSDKDSKAKFDQLTQLRQQLASLNMAAVDPSQADARKKEIAELQKREETLARDLDVANRLLLGDQAMKAGQKLPQYQNVWIELDAVRAAVPADSVLIEFARFRWLDFTSVDRKKAWLPAHYAAWIIPPAGAGNVQLIDLGDAETIDAKVAAVRNEIQDSTNKVQKLGEAAAEAELRKPLDALAKLILAPLTPHFGDAKRLLLSPDASLWLVPWAALPVDEKTYAIERWQISYLATGRNLAKVAAIDKLKFETTAPMVFADPDYNLQRTAVAAAKPTANALPNMAGTRSGFSGVLDIVPRLPGTAAEAKAILPNLKTLTKVEPTLLTNQRATETAFQAVKHPKTLVLSTHGFFLPDQELKNDGSDMNGAAGKTAVIAKDGKTLENPLLRCGLLLAGCNSKSTAGDASQDDGILTGLEIVGADLHGTDLVVLSACETGLGTVRNGEGVAGLRQAFQLAGARFVVATLWQIPDQATAQLMNDFFAGLAANKTKSAALRDAQLARIAARRDKYGAAHPLFWAAFTLTGQ